MEPTRSQIDQNIELKYESQLPHSHRKLDFVFNGDSGILETITENFLNLSYSSFEGLTNLSKPYSVFSNAKSYI